MHYRYIFTSSSETTKTTNYSRRKVCNFCRSVQLSFIEGIRHKVINSTGLAVPSKEVAGDSKTF